MASVEFDSRLLKLQEELQTMIMFLDEYEEFHQSHMNDYFTKNHQDVYAKFFNCLHTEKNFIKNCDQMSHLGCCYGLMEGHSTYCFYEDMMENKLVDGKSMSEKKGYELTKLAPKISQMMYGVHCNKIVDIGSGKGYLGQHLIKEGFKIVGIESSFGCNQSAENRALQLSPCHEMYKTVCHKLEPATLENHEELRNTLTKLFSSMEVGMSEPRAVMVGLHCCGDLASLAIKLFVKDDFFCSLNVMGCCYNLIKTGFPLSKSLENKKFSLHKNSLMLACQCPTKWKANDQTLGTSLLYRAILEKIFIDKNIDRNVVEGARFRRVGKRSRTFNEYVNCILVQLDALYLTDEEIDEYYITYEKYWDRMKKYHWLRMQLAPCIEKMILLDRLCFLLESGVDAWIVRMFSSVISPRCYSLVAHKLKSRTSEIS